MFIIFRGMEKQPPPEKIQEIVALLTRFAITSQLFQTQSEARLSKMGLTLSQMSVLSHLARRGGALRVTDIARAVEVGQPAVTKMLAKFEGAGWVRMVSHPEDRRSKMAEATPAGQQHLAEVQRSLFPDLMGFFIGWEDAEIQRFMADLSRFSAFLDARR